MPTLGVKALGLLLGLVCVLILQRIVFLLTRSRGAAILAAGVFALEPKLHFSAFSGMETNLAVALLAGACLAWMEHKPRIFLLLLGLAPVARPEAVLALPAAIAGLAAIRRSSGSLRAAGAMLLPLLPSLAWAGWCFHAIGHGLPNTFYVKAAPLAPSLAVLRTGLVAALQY